jgi:hypothetical protein
VLKTYRSIFIFLKGIYWIERKKIHFKYAYFYFSPELVITVLSHRCNCVLRNTTRQASCHTARLTWLASRTNVSEETPYSWRPEDSMHAPGRHKESLEHDGTRTSRPAKPSPNPDDVGPIVHRLMCLPVLASCDTALDRTRICSDASSTAMQYLRSLGYSGGPI